MINRFEEVSNYILGRDINYIEFKIITEYYFKFELVDNVEITDSIINFLLKNSEVDAIKYILIDRGNDKLLYELINNILDYIPDFYDKITYLIELNCKNRNILIQKKKIQLCSEFLINNEFTSYTVGDRNIDDLDGEYIKKFKSCYKNIGCEVPDKNLILNFLNRYNDYFVSDFLEIFNVYESFEALGINSDWEDDEKVIILGMLNNEHYILYRECKIYVMNQIDEYVLEDIDYICEAKELLKEKTSWRKIKRLSSSIDLLKHRFK